MWLKKEVISGKGMVTSSHPQATMAGVELLLRGGNAIDAAVATSLALGVAEPAMSGLGGRNFVVIRPQSGDVTAIHANVRSGSKAQLGVFEPISAVAPEGWPRVKEDLNTMGYKAICVPGNAACLAVALENYGSMEWKEVAEPAIRIAEEGFDIYESHIVDSMMLLAKFSESAKIYLKPNGNPYKPGDKVRNKDLAGTLKKIAEDGADVFYRGEIADSIVKDMEKHGGLITREDLENYKPTVTKASKNTYREYDFYYTLGASGGPTLMEMLNILEGYNLYECGHNTPECIHIIAETMKLAYADRFEYFADPEVEEIPLKGLVSKGYAAKLRKQVDPKKRAIRAEPGDPWRYENEETTHLTVVDEKRNMVSMTQSVHGAFGSGVVISGTGIIMNNGMKRFNPLSGYVTSIGPGKRPLSYQSPHVVLKDGEPFLGLGAPGGSRIPTTLVQVVVNIIDHGMGIQKAIDAPKFHCENREPIIVETAIPFKENVIMALWNMGHDIGSPWPGNRLASPNGILIDIKTDRLHGGVDPRRPGLAAGH